MNCACPPARARLGLVATRSNGANSTGAFADRAEVALVEPGAGLLGEDAGDAFAVQIGPLVGRAVHADGQVLQARGVDLLHRVLHDGLGVFELDRRQAALLDSRRCCAGSRSG